MITQGRGLGLGNGNLTIIWKRKAQCRWQCVITVFSTFSGGADFRVAEARVGGGK